MKREAGRLQAFEPQSGEWLQGVMETLSGSQKARFTTSLIIYFGAWINKDWIRGQCCRRRSADRQAGFPVCHVGSGNWDCQGVMFCAHTNGARIARYSYVSAGSSLRITPTSFSTGNTCVQQFQTGQARYVDPTDPLASARRRRNPLSATPRRPAASEWEILPNGDEPSCSLTSGLVCLFIIL